MLLALLLQLAMSCSNINSVATVNLQIKLTSYSYQVNHGQYILLKVIVYLSLNKYS